MQSLLILIVMIAVFYLLMIRPQQRRQREHQAMLSKLGTDDLVITRGGVIGRIARASDQLLVLEMLDHTQVCVPRAYVEGKWTGALPELAPAAAA